MSSVDQTVIETSYRIVWPDRTVRHVISRGVLRTSTGQVDTSKNLPFLQHS